MAWIAGHSTPVSMPSSFPAIRYRMRADRYPTPKKQIDRSPSPVPWLTSRGMMFNPPHVHLVCHRGISETDDPQIPSLLLTSGEAACASLRKRTKMPPPRLTRTGPDRSRFMTMCSDEQSAVPFIRGTHRKDGSGAGTDNPQ